MILVDVNLLVDATMTSARDHEAARAWLQDQLTATARVGLPWASITGFVRVAGQARAWERPLPVADALTVVGSWLSRPCAWIPQPGPRHLELLEALLGSQPAVRLVSDAHLAAIAIEHGLVLASRDRDFARWADLGLRSLDPLA
ncbi:MAG: PIN domain-containing protein [Solirubrobacteraceae bacterium]|nr:PIN domain-containing protein [Solirubrobacteraceae bacterium]